MFSKKIESKKMKNNIRLLLILVSLVVTQNIQAQFNVSIGGEGALMNGSLKKTASYGFGTTVGVEIGISNKSGFTIQAGYLHLVPEERYASAYMIPYQAGLKMYFNSKEHGAYFHPYVGGHTVSETTKSFSVRSYTKPEETFTFRGISYGLGIGFIAHKKIDIAIRYNLIAKNNGTINYLGLRVAYVLF